MTITKPKAMRVESRLLRQAARFALVASMVVAVDAIINQGATTLYAQQGVRANLAVCKNATGSDTVEDSLSRLKNLPRATPDLADAITECESKATALRQEEEKLWVRALEAKKNWDCTDSRRLFKTLLEKASLYRRQANSEFKRLGDCGEQIPAEDNPDLLLQHAKTDYKGKNFRAAREQAWRIVGLKNSLGEQARGLLKDIEEVEIVNDLLG